MRLGDAHYRTSGGAVASASTTPAREPEAAGTFSTTAPTPGAAPFEMPTWAQPGMRVRIVHPNYQDDGCSGEVKGGNADGCWVRYVFTEVRWYPWSQLAALDASPAASPSSCADGACTDVIYCGKHAREDSLCSEQRSTEPEDTSETAPIATGPRAAAVLTSPRAEAPRSPGALHAQPGEVAPSAGGPAAQTHQAGAFYLGRVEAPESWVTSTDKDHAHAFAVQNPDPTEGALARALAAAWARGHSDGTTQADIAADKLEAQRSSSPDPAWVLGWRAAVRFIRERWEFGGDEMARVLESEMDRRLCDPFRREEQRSSRPLDGPTATAALYRQIDADLREAIRQRDAAVAELGAVKAANRDHVEAIDILQSSGTTAGYLEMKEKRDAAVAELGTVKADRAGLIEALAVRDCEADMLAERLRAAHGVMTDLEAVGVRATLVLDREVST